ncbi:DUF1870 family protein, partial [Escherichia coli]|nr:DUF1870 family protein [Escherichia coli]
MNAYELQALRHIFAMTIDECATLMNPLMILVKIIKLRWI